MNVISLLDSSCIASAIVEDMKDAVADYCRSFYSETFEEVLTAPEKHRVIERIRRGHPVTSDEIRDVVVAFLNSWRCRISKKRSEDLRRALQTAQAHLDNLPPELEQLQPEHLKTIAEFFDSLCAIDNVKGTAAAKTLALLRPELFVMWDAKIAENYGCAGNGIGYCRFLLTMRDIARQARNYYGDKQHSLEEYICPTARNWIPPLAKLMDEWNWVRRDSFG